MQYFLKAQKVVKRYASSEEVLGLRVDMAEARAMQGENEWAVEELTRLESLPIPQGGISEVRCIKGRALMALDRPPEARMELEQALAEARQRSMRYREGEALLAISEWERSFGSPQRAASIHAESERVLRACGVLDPGRASHRGRSPGPGAPETHAPAVVKPAVSLRILHHLARQGGLTTAMGDSEVAPLSLTQKGIATGLALPRNQFSVALRRLETRGLVVGRTRFVKGAPRRLKVYLLTEAGAQVLRR